MMAKVIYLLCMLTSLASAGLSFRSYRQTKHPILFWTALSFGGFSLSNLLLILDKTIFLTTMDLLPLRLIVTLVAVSALLYGLLQGEK